MRSSWTSNEDGDDVDDEDEDEDAGVEQQGEEAGDSMKIAELKQHCAKPEVVEVGHSRGGSAAARLPQGVPQRHPRASTLVPEAQVFAGEARSREAPGSPRVIEATGSRSSATPTRRRRRARSSSRRPRMNHGEDGQDRHRLPGASRRFFQVPDQTEDDLRRENY